MDARDAKDTRDATGARDETAAFLADVLPRLREADAALHGGDARGRVAMWSQREPVSLFGGARTNTGWRDIRATFAWLGETFTRCESFEIEVVAAGAAGDQAYLAAIERTTAAVGGGAPGAYALRVTTVFRREDGAWKAVHRHADPLNQDAAAVALLRRLAGTA